MVANQEAFGPSAGPIPSRLFDAQPPTAEKELDRLVGRLHERATEFARLPVPRKIELLADCMKRTHLVAEDWVAAACRAKAIAPDSAVAGEEWLAGPGVSLRNMRLLLRSLSEIAIHGAPVVGDKMVRELEGGTIGIRVTPYDRFDSVFYGGLTAEAHLQPGIGRGDLTDHRASFYKKRDPEGCVSLILGAGNVASIPPMDILAKMFIDGSVVLLKMNPVNEYLGPIFERAFKPLIDRGYLALVYGGAEVGAYLCYHPSVGDVHITGSDKTHDLIVWGPPGPEREDRKRRNDPLLKKPITSELGNVSPVLIVPGPYTDGELANMAENCAGMITNNASFNCNAAKLLVLPKGWRQRDAFLGLLSKVLEKVPPRRAYYPGASSRYDLLTAGKADVRKFGAPGDTHALPWTLVLGLDSDNAAEKNFAVEPFCSMLSETSIGSDDPLEFLRASVPFTNDRVWGTLNTMYFVHPTVESSPAGKAALDAAIRELRYGTVAINVWPAMGYFLTSTPWGGHPSATLANVQSGLGWVHNSLMLEGLEKVVLHGPLKAFPKHPYFPDHKTLLDVGRRLVDFEASPSWLKVPGIAAAALRG